MVGVLHDFIGIMCWCIACLGWKGYGCALLCCDDFKISSVKLKLRSDILVDLWARWLLMCWHSYFETVCFGRGSIFRVLYSHILVLLWGLSFSHFISQVSYVWTIMAYCLWVFSVGSFVKHMVNIIKFWSFVF